MRDGKWKLVEHYDDERVELFDLDADVGERRDLSASDPARAAAMRKQLRSWRASVGAQENTPNPTVDQNLYRQLYVDFDPTTVRSASGRRCRVDGGGDLARADERGSRAAATIRPHSSRREQLHRAGDQLVRS